MEYRKDGTAHGKLDDLLNVMLLIQEYGKVHRSLVRVFMVNDICQMSSW